MKFPSNPLFLVLAVLMLAVGICQGSPPGSQQALKLTNGRETVSWHRQNGPKGQTGKRHEGPNIRCRIKLEAPTNLHDVVKRSSSQFEADKGRCLTHERNRRQVMAGTRWCGNGNSADSYDDLGYFSSVDKCCRAHDHCDRFVTGDNTSYGVTNDTPFTWSDCVCDDAFRVCLHRVDSYMSSLVGKIFFDVVVTSKCLEFDENDGTTATAVDKGTYARREPTSTWSFWNWFD